MCGWRCSCGWRDFSAFSNCLRARRGILSKPLIERREVSVLYLRPGAFAAMNPLAAALSALARVKIRERLSKAEELSGAATAEPPVEAIRLCTLSGKPLPILHVTAKGAQQGNSANRSGVEEAGYPMAVDQLAKFVGAFKA